MLTPHERRQLEDLGYWFLRDLAGITASTFFYGIFVLLFCISTSAVLQREDKSRATWAMFGATVTSFLLATLYWTADVADLVIYISATLIEGVNGAADSGWVVASDPRFLPLDQIMNWTLQALQIVNDVVVIWRAWVLCAEYQWAILGPLTLLLGTFATSFAFLGITLDKDKLRAYYASNDNVMHPLLYASGALSLATNILSVLLIAYRLWTSRTSWNFRTNSRWSQPQRILLMIIESGALYGACQIAVLFTLGKADTPPTTGFFLDLIIWEGYIQTTAMYPTIVLLLIEYKRSFADLDCFVSTSLIEAIDTSRPYP
ncbi:hypothetical protein FPV67DRAFT_242352 [Lyophyllum atratum]|nr:hypothetical protein FPV67DRAFT_242352 [Lyophyllum atratum]